MLRALSGILDNLDRVPNKVDLAMLLPDELELTLKAGV
jgi:hypothetical protein